MEVALPADSYPGLLGSVGRVVGSFNRIVVSESRSIPFEPRIGRRRL
jgi:hypothetical protein